MANQPLKNNWSVRGRTLVPASAPGSAAVIVDTQISVLENGPDIDMRPASVGQSSVGAPVPNTDSYGTPIDANLAVHLIKNNKAAQQDTTIRQISSNILLEFAKAKVVTPLKQSGLESVISDTDTPLVTNDLTSLTVTFDKSIILKILSQPKCEGVRCYLCSNGQGAKKHYSILLIGVDSAGYDLNYEDYLNNGNSLAADNIKIGKIDTNSLMADFGYPPDTGEDTDTLVVDEIPDQYVLRKLADMQ